MPQFPGEHLALPAAVNLVTVAAFFQLVSFAANTIATATDRFRTKRTAVFDHNLQCNTNIIATIKGATSRYFELFLGSSKIVVNWKETFK